MATNRNTTAHTCSLCVKTGRARCDKQGQVCALRRMSGKQSLDKSVPPFLAMSNSETRSGRKYQVLRVHSESGAPGAEPNHRHEDFQSRIVDGRSVGYGRNFCQTHNGKSGTYGSIVKPFAGPDKGFGQMVRRRFPFCQAS